MADSARRFGQWYVSIVLALAASSACRDEQAGPRRRGSAPAPAAPRLLDALPLDLSHRSEATWAGGTVRYHGTRVRPSRPQRGEQVTLTHFFQALRAPPKGWHFFTHVIDPDTGAMLMNADHEIQEGALPLAQWPVGKIVADEHRVPMPPAAARVVLGFWKGESRLAVDQPDAHDGQWRVLGPRLEGPEAALPEYVVRHTAKPPAIDGDLGDAAWGDAQAVQLRNSFDGSDTALRTTARLLYDERYLYVAFDAQDPDVWGTLMARDEPIYTQEAVEIFLDADADGATYNELQVSPNNVVFDAYFPARRQGMDLSFDSRATTAVKVRGTVNNPSDRDEGWTVEMRIPYEPLAKVPRVPPVRGDRWRFNLYRLEHLQRKTVEGHAFSPLFVGDFHHLPRFAWLVFD
ncbi:MAG TPA: sugar-binding protein [Myxococcaceae bacterium]|nr:sugar-binding protein [Myxococcaceae bacterium]